MSSYPDQGNTARLNDTYNTELNGYSAETTMSLHEIDCLSNYLGKSNYYLEFGSGYSTILASKLPGISIISLESDQEYLNFLQQELVHKGISLSNIEFLHLDIGPTKEWGYPSSPSSTTVFPNYTLDAMSKLKLVDFTPDLILIDGRFRVASFLWCLLMFPKAIILFDDYLERDHYHAVEEVLRPKKKVGRIAIFKVPNRISRKKTLKALELVLQYSYEPS